MKASRIPILLLALLAGCNRPTHGKIFGDAYLVEDLGDEVNLAGVTVHLIPEPDRDTANLDTTLSNICVQRNRFIEQARGDTTGPAGATRDSLGEIGRDANARAWRARQRILEPLVRRTVRTNERAQFVIDSVEPGDYRLWSDTIINDRHWTWLRPVEVEAGDSVRVNLTNANADENPFRCVAP